MAKSYPPKQLLASLSVLLTLSATILATDCASAEFCNPTYPECAQLCLGDFDNSESLVHSCGGVWSVMCGQKDNILDVYAIVWLHCAQRNCSAIDGAAQNAWDCFTSACKNRGYSMAVSLVPAGYTLNADQLSTTTLPTTKVQGSLTTSASYSSNPKISATSLTGTASITQPARTSEPSHKTNADIIVGSVVGPIAFFILVGAALYYRYRLRRVNSISPIMEPLNGEPVADAPPETPAETPAEDSNVPLSDLSDGHKTMYRVRLIPAYDQKSIDRFQDKLADILNILGTTIYIHSFSSSQEPRKYMAVVSFIYIPNVLVGRKGPLELTWPTLEPNVQSSKISIDKYFFGWTNLSPIKNDEYYSIDCVVIPGWGAHALGTFTAPREPGQKTPSYVWLNQLTEDFPQLRVWLYGYDSNLKDPRTRADESEWANEFCSQLNIIRRGIPSDKIVPIIFIVHSLGGWIFKRAMIRLDIQRRSSPKRFPRDWLSTYGALFFGVPGTQGMELRALARLVYDTPAGITFQHLDAKFSHNTRLDMHNQFCDAFPFRESRIVQFYEQETSPTVTEDPVTKEWRRDGPEALLVPLSSANCGRSWETKNLESIQGDHYTMVKFRRDDASGLPRVMQVVSDFCTDAPETIRQRINKYLKDPNHRF